MPKVQEKVKEIFGKEPRKDVRDEAVAVGAAIQAGGERRSEGRAAAGRNAAEPA
jgi:molecular chaperone DnaK (HSP70)